MIIDGPTGMALIPGNNGENCPGNGKYAGECCCDECGYALCCLETHRPEICIICADLHCPRALGRDLTKGDFGQRDRH